MSTCPCDYLEKKYPFEREKNVVFDDSYDEETGSARHDYYINGDKANIISVTTIIHENFGHFDADAIIKKILKSAKHQNDPDYKYYQMEPETIKKMWDDNRDDAATRGTAMHLHIEQFYNHYPFEDDTVEFKQFLEFHEIAQKEGLQAFRTELVVYDEYHRLAGSIDMLFQDAEGNLWIYDWKRSKEFRFDNKWQKGEGVLSHLDDCNIIHYSLQLNMYKCILERFYGVKVAGMCLVRCHPNIDSYDRVFVKDMQKEIKLILEEREIQLYPHKRDEILANRKKAKQESWKQSCLLCDSDSD